MYGDSLWAGRSGSDCPQCKIFLFSAASKLALGPTQPPIQWAPGVNRPEREAETPSPTSGEVKNRGV
jgi:hypothetical protein